MNGFHGLSLHRYSLERDATDRYRQVLVTVSVLLCCGNVWFTWFIDESREWEEAVRDGGRVPRARHREAAGRSIAVPSIGTRNLPVRLATAVPAAWRRRGTSALGAASGAVLARLGRRAGTGPPPGMMLTCTRTADSNRKALNASFQRADFQSAEFRRRESNPRRVIMGHVLFPTELLRWHNEPPAPNGTRRAMLSLSAPDRYAEPEPLFEPRSRYSGDERRSGGRRDSFGTSRTRHFRPGGTGWSVTGYRHAAPWAGVCIRSGAAGRSKMSELSKSIPGARASRFGATKKPRSSHMPAGVSGPGDRWRMFLPRASRPMFGRPTS